MTIRDRFFRAVSVGVTIHDRFLRAVSVAVMGVYRPGRRSSRGLTIRDRFPRAVSVAVMVGDRLVRPSSGRVMGWHRLTRVGLSATVVLYCCARFGTRRGVDDCGAVGTIRELRVDGDCGARVAAFLRSTLDPGG
jgi:hypothetical protein